jgi:hypothetical protein
VAGKPVASGATAGIFLLSALVVFAGAGLVVGWAIGYPIAGGAAGAMIGIPVSFYLVYRRYRDL